MVLASFLSASSYSLFPCLTRAAADAATGRDPHVARAAKGVVERTTRGVSCSETSGEPFNLHTLQ